MKINPYIVGLLVFSPAMLLSQVSYDDVAVIMNQNDNNSLEIGHYFAEKRDIPEGNLIYVSCPSVEMIDSAGFVDVLGQIREKLQSQDPEGRISYLVTTRGLPFNVRKSADCMGVNGAYHCSSFDSEISLLFSNWEDKILTGDGVMNPYYDSYGYFDRDSYGIYLVTRLDAYTVNDVKKMIDRSGPGMEVAKNSAHIIIDFSGLGGGEEQVFTAFTEPAVNFLLTNEWHVEFNPSDEFITDRDQVLAYFNINYQPSNKVLDFDWHRGSISEIFLPTGNLTFYKDQNVFNELSIPDLAAEGASSGSTYVNGFFLSQAIQLEKLYRRYLDESAQPPFNLAECYHMAMPRLSSQYLILGDPKTSLTIIQSNVDETGPSAGVVLFPNPASEWMSFTFDAEKKGQYTISITDITGRVLVKKDISLEEGLITERIDLGMVPAGIYVFRLSGPGPVDRMLTFIRSER